MKNPVLEGAEWVMARAKQVQVNDSNVLWLMQELQKELEQTPVWPEAMHLSGVSEDDQLTYLFVVDALNFCFWPIAPERRWFVEINNRLHTGYYALSLSLKNAFEHKVDITDPRNLGMILNGVDGCLPQLMPQRQQALAEAMAKLREHYAGRVRNLIISEDSALALAKKIARDFESFRDVAVYRGKEIWFLKRAQIFVADVWGCFRGKGIGDIPGISELTAFADYRVPQILEYYGVIAYSPELRKKINDGVLLASGSEEEVEIRAAAIVAVEKIWQALGGKLNAVQVDWLLWEAAQKLKKIMALPHHRTRTIFY